MAVEPFATISKNAGAKEVYSPYAEPIEDLTIAAYFASTDRIEEDPETVEAFIAAMKESQQYAEDHPDDAKAVLPQYTELDCDDVDTVTRPKYPQQVPRDANERSIELSAETGWQNEPVDVDDLLHEDA